VRDDLTIAKCGSSMWFLTLGFSLCYGSLFAKLFRLYTIFTSRKLVVPRLSNKKLFGIVLAFLIVDFMLLVTYSVLSPPEPNVYSAFVASAEDLATGERLFTFNMCNFHVNSPVLYLIIACKFFVALSGAVMSFVIRQVDRRFSATSALGWAFYNMGITIIIAVLILLFFKADSDLETTLFTPVFCGLWIVLITLVALTLDSNVLLACQDISKPLRKMLNPKDSKESKDRAAAKKVSGGSISSGEPEPDSDAKRSHSGTVFVVNREMFPSKYEDFEPELLEKILEELNFQRSAVRRALIPSSPTASTELSDTGERHRTSTVIPPRFNSKSKALSLSPENSKGASESPTPASKPSTTSATQPIACELSRLQDVPAISSELATAPLSIDLPEVLVEPIIKTEDYQDFKSGD